MSSSLMLGISRLMLLMVCGSFIVGCSSIEVVKEESAFGSFNWANDCAFQSNQENSSENQHLGLSSCPEKSVEELAKLAELGSSFKYLSYLGIEESKLDSYFFPYDKVVVELFELTGSLVVNKLDKFSENLKDLPIEERSFSTEELSSNNTYGSNNSTRELTIFDKLVRESKETYPHFNRSEFVLSQARRYLGVPYRYGGTTPSGFDCSGLVYYAYKKAGVSLPRTAHDQYLNSTPVAKDELRPGDLVFFKTRRSHRISHVGIYMGDNQFIHSRSRGKTVTITSLSNSYFGKRFVRGGRV